MSDAHSQREVSPRSAPVRAQSRAAATWAIGRLAAGLQGIYGPRSDQAFGILMYHRVTDPIAGLATPTWNVPPALLRAQLAGLLDRGFKPLPLARLVEERQRQVPPPPKSFVVTFDDGYANNLLAALPVLKELNVPATIFLATSYQDATRPFPFDDWSATGSEEVPEQSWRPLTTRECQTLLDSGLIELGAHTHTHQRFVGRPEDFRQDMAQCLQTLRDKFGLERPSFALPYGASDAEMLDEVQRSGVSCCLTTAARTVALSDNPFDWGRFDISAQDTPGTLAAKLSGWYNSVATAGKALVRPLKTWKARRGRISALTPTA